MLIDDLRSFVDDRQAEVARTSSAGVELLERHRNDRLDELWLDHDLGEGDTIWPVVEVLERAAFDGHPIDVGTIIIHSANPAGAARMTQVLRHWGYPVRVATGARDVGYLDSASPTLPNDPHPCPACGADPVQSTCRCLPSPNRASP